MKRQNPSKQSSLPESKRQRLSSASSQGQGQPQQRRRKPKFLSTTDMASLIQIFCYFEKRGIINRTLDQMIYESFCHLSHQMDQKERKDSKEQKAKPQQRLPDELQSRLITILYPSKKYLSCSHWCQIRQLKAQLYGYRCLSRDLPLKKRTVELIDGIDNPFSKQRMFTDVIANNPSNIASVSRDNINERSLNLRAKKLWIEENISLQRKEGNDDNVDSLHSLPVLTDTTPHTIESLVYQRQFNMLNKLSHRRDMLTRYVKNKQHAMQSSSSRSNANANKNAKESEQDEDEFEHSKKELLMVRLVELQRHMRHELLECHLKESVYNCDDTECEALLNPNGFQRQAKVGLHFEPHINQSNHPPSAITSLQQYPYNFKGQS